MKINEVTEGIEQMAEKLRKDYESKINVLDQHKIRGLHRKVTMNEEKLRETESITKDLNLKLSQRIDEIGNHRINFR